MENRTRKPHSFENIIVNDSKLNTGRNSSAPFPGMAVLSEAQIPQIEDVRFTALDLTVTDNGDATGGFNASAMLHLPPTRILIQTAFLSLTCNSLGAGLLDGTYLASVGSAAATAYPQSGGAVLLIPATALAVSSGEASIEVVNITALSIDAVTPTDIFLNITVPDASITATGIINVDGVFRMIYLDISDGG